MSENLFRKAALDKLASPEQLDVLARVTSPTGWLALGTVGMLLFGVVAWSILGSVPTRVDGEGILIRGGGLRQVESTGDGVLAEFSLRVGDEVQAGARIGTISLPQLADKVETAKLTYEQQQREAEASAAEDAATIAGLRADQSRARNELARANEDLQLKKQMLEKGLVTRRQVSQLERDRSSLAAQLNSIDAQVRQVEQRIRTRRMGAEQTRLTLQELETASKRTSELTALKAGRVIEVKKNVGDQVRTGEVIAVLEPLEGDLQPVVFVNSKLAKQIRPDMETQVSPTSVKKEEFGFMVAKVASVSDFPITPEGAQAVVANASLVRELLGSESKVELRAALVSNPETPSGYQWSSSSGPPFRIAGGSRISVSVVVDRKPPITYVLPLIKSKLGVS